MSIRLVITLFISLLFNHASQAQKIVFVDAENSMPIPAVNVYHNSGALIGITDKNGELEWSQLGIPNNSRPISATAQHISYEPQSIRIEDTQSEYLIELIPRKYTVDEITVSPDVDDVIVLKGYYRSLETFDLRYKYYSDGIIEYYIPTNGANPKYRLVDFRIYRDSAVAEDYDRRIGPFSQIPRVVEITPENLKDRLQQYQIKPESNGRSTLFKKGIKTGYIINSNDGSNTQLYIDQVLPDTVKNEKIFRIEAKTRQSVHIENYVSRSLKKTTPYELKSAYQNIIGSIKRKNEHGYVPYEGLNEFYVIERSSISLKAYKEIEKQLTKNIYKTPEKSNYQNEFWKDLDAFDVPPAPVLRGNKLKLVE